ncbi:hypothetical protein HYH03_010045 [Edaphochlamys debaryana]|uniref:F-box domain-containing protein n=1 Tax=Edaphochlamys debaryana TaxID=47281 RepID=A0A835XXY5_9CHLO|nr:hypothetical protein HYH03_010045 [Edaphochlamys debaryana]|eukprot:KAG2491677.1 hypothetical protein HYH03_010045 [Edaphochlamys debaryana]
MADASSAEALNAKAGSHLLEAVPGGAAPEVPEAGEGPHEALGRPDILVEILCRLDSVEELAAAATVGRAWRDAAAHDLPWRRLYVRAFGQPQSWEKRRSYREQCLRRAALQGHVSPAALPYGTALEPYDAACGIRTLAVTYDPVMCCLVRAVRSVTLLGNATDVALQALPLAPPPSPSPGLPLVSPHAASTTTGTATACTPQADTEGGSGAVAASEGAGTPTAADTGVAAAAAGPKAVPAPEGARWVCLLSPDGNPPQRAPVPEAGAAADGPAAAAVEALAELLPTVMCAADGLLYLPAGARGADLAVWDLRAALGPAAGAPASTAAGSSTSAPGPATASAAAPGAVGEAPEPHPLLGPPPHAAPYWLPEASGFHTARLLAAAADGPLAVSGCDGGQLWFWHARERRATGSADIRAWTGLPVVQAFPKPLARPGAGRHRLRLSVCAASGLAAALLMSPLAPEVHLYRAAPLGGAAAAAGDRTGSAAGANLGGGAGAGARGAVGQLLRVLPTPGGAPGDGLALFRGHLLALSVLASDVMGARFGGNGGSSVLVTVTASVWRLPVQGGAKREEGHGLEEVEEEAGSQEQEEEDAAAVEEAWTHPVRLYSSRLQLEHPRSLVLGRMKPLLAASEDRLLLTAPRNVGGRPPHHQLLSLEYAFGRGEDGDDSDEDESEEYGSADEGSEQAAEGPGTAAEAGAGATAAGSAQGPKTPLQPRSRPRRRGVCYRGAAGSGSFHVISETDRLPWGEVIEDAGQVVVAVVPTPRHLALLSEDNQLRLYGIDRP